jgi:alpha-beta hydrolase superfamily lysophospholipase
MPANDTQCEVISLMSDGLVLNGTLHLPPLERPPIVIGLHGLYSSQDSPKQIALARACNQLGIAYLRFDHRGCGRSQGEFEKVTSLAARCRDLKSVIETVKSWNKTDDRIGLFGSSMGGTVSLSVAADLQVEGIVSFAAPLRSDTTDALYPQHSDKETTPIYLDANKTNFDISEKISRIANILIVHGEADETVPVSHAREIYDLACEPKKLILQQGGDHRMSDERHQKVFIREAAAWLR